MWPADYFWRSNTQPSRGAVAREIWIFSDGGSWSVRDPDEDAIIPGWPQRVGALRRPMTGSGPDLRCAIAHRGISRFRVRCFASPRNDDLALRRDPRQMNGPPERLLHQIEGIDENAQAEQPAGPESREMGAPQVDRLVGVQHGQRIAHHRRCRIHAQHDGFAIEAVDPDIVRDLPDNLEHGGLAAARAEKWKHVGRAVDRPIDVLVDQGFEAFSWRSLIALCTARE